MQRGREELDAQRDQLRASKARLAADTQLKAEQHELAAQKWKCHMDARSSEWEATRAASQVLLSFLLSLAHSHQQVSHL